MLVTAADVQDRDGGTLVLATLFGQFPFLRKLFADSAYAGPIFRDGTARAMPSLVVEIVKRSDHAKGFVVEPKRWIVERSIAWLNRCRRLAKDWENRNLNALNFLRLASIRLMVTGAKARARVDFLLEATRGGLIQASCDRRRRDFWPIAH
jgi:transposase